MKNALPNLASTLYLIGGPATFIYLTFFDGYEYTAWNWLIAIPVNLFLATIWPLYWLVIHWLPTP